MTKRMILSIAMILVAVSAVAGGAVAYFSDIKIIEGNTFATGEVSLGEVTGMPMTVTGLVPGESRTLAASFTYDGSVNADVYLGVSGTGDTDYLADVLEIVIENNAQTVNYYNGLVSGLSSAWTRIAENISGGTTRYYKVTITLDSSVGNEYQGKTNTDTVIMLYAVQAGGSAPDVSPHPYYPNITLTPTP